MPLYNPTTGATIADDSITNADINSAAAIAYSKLATLATGKVVAGNAGVPTATTLGGDVTIAADGTVTIANSAVTAAKSSTGTGATNLTVGNDARLSDTRTPTDGSVTNAKVNSSAAIAYSKLALTGAILNADLAGSIAGSKLSNATLGATQIGVLPCARVYNSATVSHATSGTAQAVVMDSERFDTDTTHFTSAAALTGTVDKTASSATLAGTGTLFTSELTVGQMIAVPGTATERAVVSAIASDTSLTVAIAFANTASGQTASRTNTGLVCRTAGTYLIGGGLTFASNAVGWRSAAIQLNATTNIAFQRKSPVTGTSTDFALSSVYPLVVNDFVELVGNQTSTAALNMTANGNYSPELSMIWLGA